MTARQLTRWPLLIGIGVVAMVALAACGGDSSTPSAPGGLGPGGAAPGGAAPGGAAPGGAGPGGAAAPGGGGTGSDASYVAALCKASKTFSDDMTKVTKDPSKLTDPKDIAKAFVEPFDAFAKAVSKAKPPSDMKEYHSQMVKVLNDIVAQLKSGNSDSMTTTFNDLPQPPQGLQDRLQKAAAKNTDCVDSGFLAN